MGLGVKDWSVDDCIRKFQDLCSTAFTPRFGLGVQQVASGIFHTSKYKTEPFNETLRRTFGDDQLFGGRSEERRYQRKVAIVSTYGTGQEAVILANYNRPQRTEELGKPVNMLLLKPELTFILQITSSNDHRLRQMKSRFGKR